MSGKRKKGSEKAAPRAYGRLTRHERDTVQRMLERRASCREIARELGRSPSTVSAEVASHRFVTAPKPRRGERVDASADLSAACPRLAAWPRFSTPARAFRAMLGDDAAALLDAYGVGDVALGDLDLTPGLIERARAERGDAPLA